MNITSITGYTPIRQAQKVNFGLTVSDEMDKLLSDSAQKMKGEVGKKWIATKREMKNALSDKYKLIIEDNNPFYPPKKLIVESLYGNRWFVGSLNNGELLSLEKLNDLVSELHAVNREEHDKSSDNTITLSEF